MRGLARAMQVIETLLPLSERYTGEALRVIAGVTYFGNSEKAKRELGFAPRAGDPSETTARALEMLYMEMLHGCAAIAECGTVHSDETYIPKV